MKTIKLFEEFKEATSCPVPTKDLEVNTKNRDRAIKAEHIEYGPLNVDEPAGYWEHLADHWGTSVEAAKKSTCGNCVAFGRKFHLMFPDGSYKKYDANALEFIRQKDSLAEANKIK